MVRFSISAEPEVVDVARLERELRRREGVGIVGKPLVPGVVGDARVGDVPVNAGLQNAGLQDGGAAGVAVDADPLGGEVG